jgi:hypothetical protein
MHAMHTLLPCLFLVCCASAEPDLRKPQTATAGNPTGDTAAVFHVWSPDGSRFKLRCTDTLTTLSSQGGGLIPLTDTDRATYLQRYAAQYTDAALYFCSILRCGEGNPTITLLNLRDDDHDLLWLSYDIYGRMNGLDTLISSYGDGQLTTTEIAYRDQYGSLLIAQVRHETFRDEQDTMAYMIDTLIFQSSSSRVDEVPTDPNVPPEHYSLMREPRDLTRHWMEQFANSAPTKVERRSLMSVVPPGKQVFQVAIGDLNGDSWNDYALVLQDDPDGVRDLQIVFTVHDGRGFAQQALYAGLLPDRHSGGFHDPIGEPGLSGISIEGGHLVIARFEGSAWKSESRQEFTYSPKLDGFFLTLEQGRSYHAPTVDVMDAELASYEAMQQQGKALSAEEVERVAFLRKMKEDYMYKPVHYPIGNKPLGSWKY